MINLKTSASRDWKIYFPLICRDIQILDRGDLAGMESSGVEG